MNTFFRINVIVVFLCSIVSCQSPYSSYINDDINANNLYLDKHFTKHDQYQIETSDQVFSLTTEIKEIVARELPEKENIDLRAKELVRFIFEYTDKPLEYDLNANTIATETFANRRANCLSLTIMAYVIAKEAGINVNFQEIEVPEFWIRNGKYTVLTGHVNLLVTADDFNEELLARKSLEIDFDPKASERTFRRTIVSKKRMLAMFYNNKGANFIINKQFDHAYAYLKKATEVDPSFTTSWGNLGILYRSSGLQTAAVDVYRYALSQDNNNFAALVNLSSILKFRSSAIAFDQTTEQDKRLAKTFEADKEEAKIIDELLLSKRRANPYYHIMLADSAFSQQEYEQAVRHYLRAMVLNSNLHEIYSGLSSVYFEMGNYKQSKTLLTKAIELNPKEQLENKYIAKLNKINSFVAK